MLARTKKICLIEDYLGWLHWWTLNGCRLEQLLRLPDIKVANSGRSKLGPRLRTTTTLPSDCVLDGRPPYNTFQHLCPLPPPPSVFPLIMTRPHFHCTVLSVFCWRAQSAIPEGICSAKLLQRTNKDGHIVQILWMAVSAESQTTLEGLLRAKLNQFLQMILKLPMR